MTTPEQHAGDPNWAWWEADALVSAYVSNPSKYRELTVNEANFQALLEQHMIYSGKLHKFIRQAFSTEHCDLDVDLIECVNDFAKAFVKEGRLVDKSDKSDKPSMSTFMSNYFDE